ncbi:MAG: hypothetical protein ACI87E_002302 [Mariniblastus sp.]|jgi:hypothetical protein
MKLQFLPTVYSVCQLAPDSNIPTWAQLTFLALIRTEDELTIVAPTPVVPKDVKAQHDFACFRVVGSMEFDMIGVIAAISRVLADANIPLLSISTYNTDYFLVSQSNQEPARLALTNAGYEFKF